MRIKRLKHILFTSFFIALFDVVMFMLLYTVLINRGESGFLSKVLFVFLCICGLCVSVFELVTSDAIDYDEEGIHAYRTFGKEVFCSWESITNVEMRKFAKHGEMIIIYNNERFLTPTKLSFDAKSSEALMIRKSQNFMTLLRNRRSDIEIGYNG